MKSNALEMVRTFVCYETLRDTGVSIIDCMPRDSKECTDILLWWSVCVCVECAYVYSACVSLCKRLFWGTWECCWEGCERPYGVIWLSPSLCSSDGGTTHQHVLGKWGRGGWRGPQQVRVGRGQTTGPWGGEGCCLYIIEGRSNDRTSGDFPLQREAEWQGRSMRALWC